MTEKECDIKAKNQRDFVRGPSVYQDTNFTNRSFIRLSLWWTNCGFFCQKSEIQKCMGHIKKNLRRKEQNPQVRNTKKNQIIF